MSSKKTKPEQASDTAKPPVAKVRIGLITASIWERAIEAGTFHNVTFERRYRDAEGNWQSAHGYDTADLLTLAKVADLAHTKILELNAASSG
jgi:hypothetical protein